MKLGTVVKFNNDNGYWVVIESAWKSCKGISKTKVFRKINLNPNWAEEDKVFTKKRAEFAEIVSTAELPEDIYNKYAEWKKMKFIVVKEEVY